jgi:hypothetical protein
MECPAGVGLTTTIVQTLKFVGGAFGVVVVLYGMCIAILKICRVSTKNISTVFINQLVWTVTTVQLVAQIATSPSTNLPGIVKTTYDALLAFLLNGVSIPAACAGTSALHSHTYVCLAALCAIACMLVLYLVVVFIPVVANNLHHVPAVRVVVKAVAVGLTVAYVPVINVALSMVMCTDSTIPVRMYLSLQQDGAALAASGIVLSAQPSRAELDVLMKVPLLASDPTQVCYEAYHSTAFYIGLATIVTFAIVYPIAMLAFVRARGKHLRSTPTGEQVHQGSKKVTLATIICGYEAALHVRQLAKSCCCCWSTLDITAWDQSAAIAAVDENENMLQDTFLGPFVNAQFRACGAWFLLVDTWLLGALAVLATVWRYPEGTSQQWGKAGLICAVLLVALWLYGTRRPFRAIRSGKAHVKAFSLLLCAIGAIENAFMTETPSGTMSNAAVAEVWSYIFVAGTVLLCIMLLVALCVGVVAEQKRNTRKAPPAGSEPKSAIKLPGWTSNSRNAKPLSSFRTLPLPVVQSETPSSTVVVHQNELFDQYVENHQPIHMHLNPMKSARNLGAAPVHPNPRRLGKASFAPSRTEQQ